MTRRLQVRSQLWLVLFITAVLWAGVVGINLNSDDYQYIESLAPMRSAMDVLRPFWSPDANPSFFRPLSNATMVVDFLISGWNGNLYHLTNLLLHLAAVWTVFYFVRDLFELTDTESLWVALVFGLAASHEYNLVVDTARADILVAVLMMWSLILARRSKREGSISGSVAAWILYAAALCGKEIAVTMIFLAPILLVSKAKEWKRTVGNIVKVAIPYVVISVLFYFYHAHFTQPISSSQPMLSEGGKSIVAMIRNGLYGIGYLIIPLNLENATALLTEYRTVTLVVIFGLFIITSWAAIRYFQKDTPNRYLKPSLFMLLTGSVVGLSFERWRLYLPSVGLAVIVVLGVRQILSKSSRSQRVGVIALVLLLGGFHLKRAVAAEYEWSKSTGMLVSLRDDLTSLLRTIPERPLTLLFVTLPSKFGSATVMQLGQNALLQYADAAQRALPTLREGSTGAVRVWSSTAVELYALDPVRGFGGLRIARSGARQFTLSTDSNARLILVPNEMGSAGIARRDILPKADDSIWTGHSLTVLRAVNRGRITDAEVTITDTTAIPIYFDGRTFLRALASTNQPILHPSR